MVCGCLEQTEKVIEEEAAEVSSPEASGGVFFIQVSRLSVSDTEEIGMVMYGNVIY